MGNVLLKGLSGGIVIEGLGGWWRKSFINIVDALKSLLETDTAISAWVTQEYPSPGSCAVYKGFPEANIKLAYPHICIINGVDREFEELITSREQFHFLGLLCRLHDNNHDKRYDNIIKFKELVEDVVANNYSLSGTADSASIVGGNPAPPYKVGPDIAQHWVQIKVFHIV